MDGEGISAIQWVKSFSFNPKNPYRGDPHEMHFAWNSLLPPSFYFLVELCCGDMGISLI